MSEKLTGISSNGQELIKRHNFDSNLIDYIREKEQRITEFLNHAEALEAELDGYKQGAKLQAGIDWHQMYVDVLKEREQARGSLAEAQNLISEIANDVKNVRKIIRQTDCPEGWTTPCTECLNEISCERSDLIDRLLKIEAALAGVPCGGAAKPRRG